MADTQKFRDRKFCAVLYPEDETHVAAIEKLKSGGYNFAAILHDKDVYEDGEHKGETKKSHWHVVVRFKNAVWNTAIAKELGIQPNYLEACANVDSALLYLVHFGNEDKFQYEYEAVFGPLRVRLSTLLAEPDEGARVLNLVDIVDNTPGPIGYSELIKKAVAAGIYADLRRMGSIASGLSTNTIMSATVNCNTIPAYLRILRISEVFLHSRETGISDPWTMIEV